MSNIVRRGPQTGIEILDDIRRSSDAETSQKKQQVVRRRSGGSSSGGSSSSGPQEKPDVSRSPNAIDQVVHKMKQQESREKEQIASPTVQRFLARRKVMQKKRDTVETLTPQEYKQELYQYGKNVNISEWHPSTTIEKRRTKEGYEYTVKYPYKGAERYKFYKEKLKDPLLGLATAFTGADPLGLKSAYYTATGQKEKVIQTKIEALEGVREAQKGGIHAVKWYLSMPTTQIGAAAVGGELIGAGTGAVEATSWGSKALLVSRGVTVAGKPLYTISASTALKAGIGVGFTSLYVKDTAPMVQKAMDTGDWGDVVGHAGVSALALPAGFEGYKIGHSVGFGRTEAYLYGKSTYKPGSPEYIRYKSALKVARKLEHVKSHKAKPLDIAKDIMRMDKSSAQKTIRFLSEHPKTTIGGSGASYTQIEGFRAPRDIDLLLKGGSKQVTSAKKYFGRLLKTRKGEHRIDIHGSDMYKPGRHHEFGFRSKTPRKISGTRYMKAGEQTFRKAVSSVKKETSYRHFKDVPDFVTHSRSLIKSAKMKLVTRHRGTVAERNLDIFLNPEKSPHFGKSDFYTRVFGKPKTIPKQRVIPLRESGYVSAESTYYHYPTSGRALPGFYGYYKTDTKQAVYTSTPLVTSTASAYIPEEETTKVLTPPKTYTPPSSSPPYSPTYTPPSSSPPYKPPVKHTVVPPPYLSSSYVSSPYKPSLVVHTGKNRYRFSDDVVLKQRYTQKKYSRVGEKYRFRSFDVPSLEKIIRGVKFKL